jgi:hypothetical protein
MTRLTGFRFKKLKLAIPKKGNPVNLVILSTQPGRFGYLPVDDEP